MINIDEDALICDLAETYQIFDYRSLPLSLVATLSAGLREDSRIYLRASGASAKLDTLLLALVADRVEAFRYGFTEDATRKKNPPISIVETICGKSIKKPTGVATFATHEQFDAALARIRGG